MATTDPKDPQRKDLSLHRFRAHIGAGHDMLASSQDTSPEVPLRHGDDSGLDAAREAADSGGQPGEGIRQPDARPIGTSPKDKRRARADQPGRHGVERRGESDRGSHPDRGEDGGQVDQVNIEAARVEISQSWSAPLPQPEILAQYEALLPGAAERILAMAEKSATGHLDTANKLADAEIDVAKRGQYLAFGLTIVAFVASIVFFALNNPIAGVAFLSVPVTMLIRSFITRS